MSAPLLANEITPESIRRIHPCALTNLLIFSLPYLCSLGSEGGRGVKEKDKVADVVSPAVTDEPVVKEKQDTSVDTGSLNVENSYLKSYLPLPTQGSTPAGNTLGMSSYANVTSVPSRKALNIRTLYTPRGNGVDVFVPVESIRAVSERFANTAYGFFLGKRVAYPVVANYGRSSYANAMIELKADAELKDTIVVAMPKLTGEGFYTCTVRVEYEWKTPRYVCCKVFGHTEEECPNNPGLGVAKNMKKPSQAPKGFSVGSNVGFNPAKEYRHVPKKSTANTSGNKKNDVEPTKHVSNLNPFDVLNSVQNDMDLGTNGETSNLVTKESNSSGSSFWNVESSSMSTNLIVKKIRNIKKLIMDRKATLVDDKGVLAKNVDYLKKGGFGTTSVLEQWRYSYENGDYDYDPYDDDMYEIQEISDKLQAICDNLDIKVRARKKK
uniref:Zinc knuckle CX2CX4HX4C n=1 Tax=Tanacetum cinerariifolium TaxID=118510 RepID=A0A699H1C6_TANCI|nr:hypothetical protein [Tanacetum cinerariifolium]